MPARSHEPGGVLRPATGAVASRSREPGSVFRPATGDRCRHIAQPGDSSMARSCYRHSPAWVHETSPPCSPKAANQRFYSRSFCRSGVSRFALALSSVLIMIAYTINIFEIPPLRMYHGSVRQQNVAVEVRPFNGHERGYVPSIRHRGPLNGIFGAQHHGHLYDIASN